MAALFVIPPKKVIEVITVSADFSRDLLAGETIDTFDCTVSVFSGEDSNPSDLLYQIPERDDAVVKQKIKEGIPGVIYDILFSIVTDTERVVEQVTRLAILPNESGATPVFIPLYLSSQPYPLNATEVFQSPSISSIFAKLNLQPAMGPEFVRGTTVVSTIDLFGSGVTYVNPPESIRGAILLQEIDLYGSGTSYSIPAENITGSIVVREIDLYGAGVSYDIPAENIRGTIEVTSIEITT